MPPGVLSSNLITVQSLDLILASPTSSDPIFRHQLLSTKLAILTNRPSQPAHRSFDSELQILQCRLDLAKACLLLRVPNIVTAGLELGLVERDCKGIVKRMCRENRIRVDKASKRIEMDGVIERRTSLGSAGDSITTRPAPTPVAASAYPSTSTNSATSSISGSTSNTSKYENRQRIITTLRVEALRLLGEVEEMQGKPERKIRWDCLATKLELEAG
jgi:hypothetical protein